MKLSRCVWLSPSELSHILCRISTGFPEHSQRPEIWEAGPSICLDSPAFLCIILFCKRFITTSGAGLRISNALPQTAPKPPLLFPSASQLDIKFRMTANTPLVSPFSSTPWLKLHITCTFGSSVCVSRCRPLDKPPILALAKVATRRSPQVALTICNTLYTLCCHLGYPYLKIHPARDEWR